MTMRWMTISVNWVNTFPQAIVDKPLCMQTPHGFLNTKMTGSNPNKAPTTQIPLRSDADREDYNNVEWNYASMVGMSLCVLNNT